MSASQPTSKEWWTSTIGEWERVDVLVNVAGIGLTKLFINTTLEQWEKVLHVNLTGDFSVLSGCRPCNGEAAPGKDHQHRILVRSTSRNRAGRIWSLKSRCLHADEGDGRGIGAVSESL